MDSSIYAPPLRHNGQSEGVGFRRKTLDATLMLHCPEGSESNGLTIVFSFTNTVAQMNRNLVYNIIPNFRQIHDHYGDIFNVAIHMPYSIFT